MNQDKESVSFKDYGNQRIINYFTNHFLTNGVKVSQLVADQGKLDEHTISTINSIRSSSMKLDATQYVDHKLCKGHINLIGGNLLVLVLTDRFGNETQLIISDKRG